MIAPDLLRELLRYEPETGKLFWLSRSPDVFLDKKQSAQGIANRWNSQNAGKQAFTATDADGYHHGSILGFYVRAHRVALAIFYGEWPTDQVDHINGNKSDNRISNLRVVTNQQNGRNQRLNAKNTSGTIGVRWDRNFKKWEAKIGVNGRTVHLGKYVSFEQAVAARNAAESLYGFHKNHGRKAI